MSSFSSSDAHPHSKPPHAPAPPKLPVHPPAPEPSASTSNAAAEKKSQKQMTKAERRELQERQRAAKAAAKAEGGGPDKPPKGAAKAKEASGRGGGGAAAGASGAGSGSGAGARGQDTARERERTASGAVTTSGAGRASLSGGAGGGGGAGAGGGADEPARTRGLRIFAHFALQRPQAPVAKGDVHPAIVRLGLLFAGFRICGANARCIATLGAFKEVIQDYTTPQGTTLARHLTTHLSAQISHLVAARPMSITMGNAIRQLKLDISGSDIDLPEQDAKDALCQKIDDYIRDRIIIADQVIQETATKKIHDGDVVLTYARSSVVEKVLLQAWEDGTRFSVYVVDSRPMLEGKRLLSVLARAGIPCTYLLLPALGAVIADVSCVLLGAASIHANGAVLARAGTALAAMLATRHSVPVVVCCETYKFSDVVQLDSFTKNELAPPGELLDAAAAAAKAPHAAPKAHAHLEVLNPLYDLTPPSAVTAVVTEVGVIPPDSISAIPLALGRTVL